MNARACLAVFLGTVLLAGPGICTGKDPRALLITVLQTDDAELARELLANTPAAVVNKPGYHASTSTYGTDSVRPPRGLQQVRVNEGQAAHFSTIYRFPEVRFLWAEDTRRGLLPNVDLVTQESKSGFDVQAELHGNEVLLQLNQYHGQSQSEYTTGHDLQQNIRTTVSGHLGGWLDAGGSLILDEGSPANRVYSLQHHNRELVRLLIKVELAP